MGDKEQKTNDQEARFSPENLSKSLMMSRRKSDFQPSDSLFAKNETILFSPSISGVQFANHPSRSSTLRGTALFPSNADIVGFLSQECAIDRDGRCTTALALF